MRGDEEKGEVRPEWMVGGQGREQMGRKTALPECGEALLPSSASDGHSLQHHILTPSHTPTISVTDYV